MEFRVITLGVVILCISTVGVLINILSVLLKVCKEFQNPKLWKYPLLYQDIAHVILGSGLILFSIYVQLELKTLCDAAGFIIVFGLFLCFFSFLTTAVILLAIQNPGKSSTLSSFHRNIVLVVLTPEVIVSGALSAIPYAATSLFDASTRYKINCLPIPASGQSVTAYGALLTALWWVILIAASICDVITALKLWKFYNRVNSAQNNVWQTQLVNQGKSLLKLLLVEHIIWTLSLLLVSVIAYIEYSVLENDASWIVMTTLAISTVLHGVFSNVGNTMWSSCCCRSSNAVQEPHRKLKKLELIKVEAKGKLRMKATWAIGKGATKRGMLKVYGISHLKSWAQEIVMLGMLRRAQHPSLIQCLWTNSSNPYYETMTLISGEIITSDSRIICLELTNGGTLQSFLQKVELPLPEPCQRMIIHDIAEGLFYLHHENILHSNLTSSCIYLKGSLQSMVLRAAVGDFEDAQIYGTLQQSLDDSIRDKRYFFLPDIRSFALIALEIVSKMCEKKFQNRYVSYDSEHVPLKLNLTNCISDEEDEFGAQYGYDIEDTHRMYESIQQEEMYYQERPERCMSPNFAMKTRNDSLENLMDKNRPTSPNFSIHNRQLTKTPDTVCSDSESDDDKEVARVNTQRRNRSPGRPLSPDVNKDSAERCLSPNRVRSPIGKVSQRKSRKDMTKYADRMLSPNRLQSPRRSLSPSMYDQNRCVSPDPMKDAKLQELRKETETGKKLSKKERKSSFSRKQKCDRTDESQVNGQAFEAFVEESGVKQSKRKDGSWLTKPTSILKSITNNETTVSVFKAKQVDEDNHLDAIEEEDIETSQNNFRQSSSTKNKDSEKAKAEVWDIIDEQFYHQCNKKASRNLKKTVSGESRSSLWSFISTPEDIDDDEELNNILDCLPGMADSSEYRKGAITVEEIMKEQENALQRKNGTKRFSYEELNKSKFELIDYYEMLKARKITIDQVPEDKREMLLNVVELTLEQKLKREGKFKDSSVIKSDELYSNTMAPSGSGVETKSSPTRVVSFRRNQQSTSTKNSSIHQQIHDPRMERAKSAPLKRPRTPMKKAEMRKPEVNPAFSETQNIAKRNRARSALKKAINNKTNFNGMQRQGRSPATERQDLTVKYATVKKINVESQVKDESVHYSQKESQVVKVPVPTKESFSITKVKPANVSVKRYSSFSSNESSSSYLYNNSDRKTDVSLTSGELTSVSSQSESDQFETDGHMTDVEGPNYSNSHIRRKLLNRGPGSRVDSGFDSGSMSSEMSDALGHHSKQYYTPVQSSKQNLNSWARNYKSMEYIPNSPLDISSKFLSPASSLPEDKFSEECAYRERPPSAVRNAFSYSLTVTGEKNHFNDNDSGIGLPKHISDKLRSNVSEMSSSSSISSDVTPTPRVISVTASANKGTLNLNQRPMSPEIPVSQRRPMSPERPMSPNVQPTEHRPILKAKARIISPDRAMPHDRSELVSERNRFSADKRPLSTNHNYGSSERPFSPSGRQIANGINPNRSTSLSPQNRVKSPERVLSSTSNQYHDSLCSKKQIETSAPVIHINQDSSVSNSSSHLRSDHSNQTAKANKRYRELVKQGVPLRASAIDSSPSRKENARNKVKESEPMSRPNTAESTVEEPVDNEQLFDHLESKGFFANRSRSPSPSKGTSPSRSIASSDRTKHGHDRKKKNKKLPLDQIVREAPDHTDHRSKPFRSQSNNHLIVSEDVFLNQPTSEDSETCSVKTTKSSGSTPSGSRPKVVVDAELVIDRIFSQNHSNDENELDVEVEAALGLDKDPFKAMNELYAPGNSESVSDLSEIPLLNGVNQKHIHECMELVSNLHVVTIRDLLPARQGSFDVLRKKLHQVGQLGTVGNQLLDIIRKCWLLDMPPTSGDLVEQLTDPVTETEV